MTDNQEIKHTATKDHSGWLYRGYLLQHPENINLDRKKWDMQSTDWEICKKIRGRQWRLLDRFSTLKKCKKTIDNWEDRDDTVSNL